MEIRKLSFFVLFSALCCCARAQQQSADSIISPKHQIAEHITAASGALVINAGVTEILKHSIHRRRPNGEDNNSFPSRHTSWAFTASSIIANELYAKSPWYTLGAHAAASGIAFQRVASRHHYASDVAAGAAIGIASTQLSYWLASKIFHTDYPASGQTTADNDFRHTLAVVSEAVWNLHSDVCMGMAVGLRGQLPLGDTWGLAATVNGGTTPVKNVDGSLSVLNTVGATVGGVGHFRLPVKSLAIESSVRAGAVRRLNSHNSIHTRRYGFTADCDVALSWRLTPKFAFNTTIGYRFTTVSPRLTTGSTPASPSHSSPTSALTLGISSVAVF